jgi:hypothetical protein
MSSKNCKSKSKVTIFYFIWSELSTCIWSCNSRFRLYLFASLRGYRLNRGWGIIHFVNLNLFQILIVIEHNEVKRGDLLMATVQSRWDCFVPRKDKLGIRVNGVSKSVNGVLKCVNGVLYTSVGVSKCVNGVLKCNFGVRDPKIGVQDHKIGVRDPEIGVRDHNFRLNNLKLSLFNPNRGVQDPKIGVRDPKIGVRDPNFRLINLKLSLFNPNRGVWNPSDTVF